MLKNTSPSLIVKIGGPDENIAETAEVYGKGLIIKHDEEGRLVRDYRTTVEHLIASYGLSIWLECVCHASPEGVWLTQEYDDTLREALAERQKSSMEYCDTAPLCRHTCERALLCRPTCQSLVEALIARMADDSVSVVHRNNAGDCTALERYYLVSPCTTDCIHDMIRAVFACHNPTHDDVARAVETMTPVRHLEDEPDEEE